MLSQFGLKARSLSSPRQFTSLYPLLLSILFGLSATGGFVYLQNTLLHRTAAAKLPSSSRFHAALPPSIGAQDQICLKDIAIVFDVSGSTEDQTSCHDCWVRTSHNPNWPNNGYFNPLPYNPDWATPGTDNQSIAQSTLCSVYPPQPFITNTYQYLTVEAELYSRNAGNWNLDTRTPGQGFWVLQRGSKVTGNNALGEDNDQRNAAGNPAQQSSNVCRPNGGGIDCTVGASNDDVCSSADGGIAADCSGYIAARPFTTYSNTPGNIPLLNGATYNADCFTGSSLSGACWSGATQPFRTIPGLEQGPSSVPWVEYDFTPVWTQTTYIWIRASGGGEQAYTWAGPSPDQIQPDLNGGGLTNNITPWTKVIYWQVSNGTINQRKDNLNADYSNSPTDNNSGYFQRALTWRDNRAENGQWRWIKLGSTATVSGTQYTLKLYQGSAGYKVDKIVFTNDPNGTTDPGGASASNLPAALRRNATGGTASATDYGNQLGPPASPGSATREACNVCNPAFGYTVNPSQCSCKLRANDTANSGYGSGQDCTTVLNPTNQLQVELETGLYSGLQPLRSAQEAVKNFAKKLNPQSDQLALLPFTAGSDNTTVQSDPTRRSKLQCLRWAAAHTSGGAAECYDTALFTNPISYTQVLSAVEKQWPESVTDIAVGLREGLEELGVSTPGNPVNSNCSTAINDGSSCNRSGTARRIMILLTDGSPDANPGNCAPGSGRPDLWEGLVGTEDQNFECAAYYASLAAANGVTLYTIGIGSSVNFDLLIELATGIDPRGDQADVVVFSGASGQFFPTLKPSDLDAIFGIISLETSCLPPSYLPIILKNS